MATVKTIESSFDSMTEEQKKANLATLGYIKNLASTTNTDIHRWDVLKIFGSGEGANLVADKKQVNKIFFEKLSALAEKKDLDFPDVESLPELSEALERSFNQNLDSRKREIQYNIDESLRQVERRHRDIQTYLTQVAEFNKQISLLKLNTDPIIEIKKEIQEVLKSGIWTNPIVREGFLYLNTASDIHLTYKNRAAGIDCELGVGQLAVKIDLNTFYMWVLPYKNNIVYDPGHRGYRYFHPHVNQDGGICWGNAGQTMNGFMKTFSIGKVLQLLHSLLTSYSDASPYVHLVALRDQHKKYSRIPAAMKHPDKIKAKAEPGEEPESTSPAFVVGSVVEAERHRYDSEPRWNMNEDRGGSGEWMRGTVTQVTSETVAVRFDMGEWNWPLDDNREYHDNQWQRPGYLRLVQI